jgi:phosphopantothenoylcysteine decarboxylase/phosphopantothenoylcysteine decarboxylase/phosphopantothenate--cysteine ligase
MTLSRNPVITTFEDETGSWVPVHIDLAQKADVLAIVPASANTMACMAQGFAPNALTSLYLANRAPVLIFPAMNGNMWTHPATQQNAAILAARDNHRIIGPEDSGMLACGAEGQGRLVSVDVIVEEILHTLTP